MISVRFKGLSAWDLGRLLIAAKDLGMAEPEIVVTNPTSVNLILADARENKIQVIKAIREIAGLGLKDAKDLAETRGAIILHGVSHGQATTGARLLEEAGALTEIRGAA